MTPVSSISAGAVQPLAAAEKLGAPNVQNTGEEAQGRSARPVMDEYVPEEKREPSGLYRMGRDEEGQPRIYFDDPEQAADEPERKDGEKDEVCVGNTDRVDREIEKLKRKRQELEQRLGAETDEARIKELERQLAQVERELKQKDNDTYRRQHTQVSKLS